MKPAGLRDLKEQQNSKTHSGHYCRAFAHLSGSHAALPGLYGGLDKDSGSSVSCGSGVRDCHLSLVGPPMSTSNPQNRSRAPK